MQQTLPGDFTLAIKDYAGDKGPLHRHNYFELIYVLEGRGIHTINENQFAYGAGDLFLLTPDDKHSFQSQEGSKFCIIDFTDSFFRRNAPVHRDKAELSHFFKELEYIFHNAAPSKGFISMGKEDEAFSRVLVQRLIMEWSNQVFYREIIIQNIVFLLLNVIARNLKQQVLKTPVKSKPENTAYEIISYIHHHIYDNDPVSIERIAAHVNLSGDYVSAYFKRQVGLPIKQFILEYKLELAQTRLLYSPLTVSQIAEELGFTDESHLNKLFTKHYSLSARQYRRKFVK